MITNATLIEYTTPAEANSRGGRTAGITTTLAAGTRGLVDQPKQSQIVAGGDLLAGVTGRLFWPIPATVTPAVDGRVTYCLDGETSPTTLQIATVGKHTHGHQSHFELYLRPLR